MFTEIFAGEGQLWGLTGRGHLVDVEPATGRLRRHQLRTACGPLAYPSGGVRMGKLWLSCNRSIAAYAPAGKRPEVVGALRSRALLASTQGVWGTQGHTLVGIAGTARGKRIDLPRALTPAQWRTAGDEAWALDLNSGARLIRAHLASGIVHPFKLAIGAGLIDALAVNRNGLWVTLEKRPVLLRFSRLHPRRALSRIALSQTMKPGNLQTFLTAGASYLWVTLFAHKEMELLRATVRK